jgi:hypothetical protein
MVQFECRILTIQSYHQSESDGDEIFLKINGKKIWPTNERYITLRDAQPGKINHTISIPKLEGAIEVELWEYDNILSSTCLGQFSLVLSESGGPFNTDLKLTSKEFARYSLAWEVLRQGPKL